MVLPEDSCMRSSDESAVTDKRKKGRKTAGRIIGVLILCAVILAGETVAQFSFDSVHMADYYNYDIKQLKKNNADVGMIIVGASQVYHACNPDVISKTLGIGEVIDASTASLTNDGGYYLLKNLLKSFDPQYVLVNLNWDRFLKKVPEGEKRGRLLATDRLPVLERLEYMLNCFPLPEYPNLSAMYRFGGTIWGASQIKKNYLEKKAVREGDWVSEDERNYRKNGFAFYNKSSARGGFEAEELHYSDDQIDPHELEYIQKTKELCEKEGVELIWITVPTSMEELYSIDNLQDNIDYVRTFTEESGHPWLNFNLMRGREDTLPDALFTDRLHLNGDGSEYFSMRLAQTIIRIDNGEDVSGLFYDSVEEMKQDVERIVACSAEVSKDGNGSVLIAARSLQNEDVIPEYRLLISTDKKHKNYEEIVSWQESSEFLLKQEQLPPGYALRLEVRPQGQEEYDAFQNEI